ncbi:FAD/NAD(P)-binding domain [Phytophthora cactorum]|nr:FAD/NAD(P)-binding domain [Phytophthora cactorum]
MQRAVMSSLPAFSVALLAPRSKDLDEIYKEDGDGGTGEVQNKFGITCTHKRRHAKGGTLCCSSEASDVQEPWHVYYLIRGAVYSKLSFRHKQLFKLLDVRFSVDMFKRRSCVNKRMCIVGAGPVGLRAAIELALLGGKVSVLEKRIKFSRENMFHL